jgi:hypothetical protein
MNGWWCGLERISVWNAGDVVAGRFYRGANWRDE